MALDDRLTLRITADAKEKFMTACSSAGREANSVLRELVDAFNEKRMRIKPSPNQKQLEIYDHES